LENWSLKRDSNFFGVTSKRYLYGLPDLLLKALCFNPNHRKNAGIKIVGSRFIGLLAHVFRL
jgi:hypothetical protein